MSEEAREEGGASPPTDHPPGGALPFRPEDFEALEEVDPEALEALKQRIVERIESWQMGAPAIFLLEATRPLSFIGSQALVVFEPLVRSLFRVPGYYTLRKLLERREDLEDLTQRIEAAEEARAESRAIAREERREARARKREERRMRRSGGK